MRVPLAASVLTIFLVAGPFAGASVPPLDHVARAAVLSGGLEPPVFADLPSFATPLAPNDPYLATQYGLAQARALPIVGARVEGPLVCVLDTGILPTHEEIANARLVAVEDFIVDRSAADGLHYHGTFVSALAGGTSGNGAGIAGLVDVDLAHGRVLNETGSGYWHEIAAGLRWCGDLAAQRPVVVSISIVGWVDEIERAWLEDAVAHVRANGGIVVASAGNENSAQPVCFDCITFPAALDGVIAVTSTSPGEVPSWWSSWGPQADIAAPGDFILSASVGSDHEYTAFSGTSFSAPIVAASLALAWDRAPELGGDELTARLYATSQDVGPPGWDIYTGHGELDVECLLAATIPCGAR